MRHGRAKQARKTLQFFERSIPSASAASGGGKQSAYHVVVDGTFVVSILQYKIPILDRLDVLLQHTPFHLYVCKSTVSELHALNEQRLKPKSKKRSAIAVEKATRPDDIFLQAIQWCHDNCQILYIQARSGNADEGIIDITSSSESLSAAASDIVALLTGSLTETAASTDPQSKRHYFCASQDEELLQRLRSISSLPSSRMLYVPLIRLARGTVLLLEQPSKSATRTNFHHERTKWTNNSTLNGPASAHATSSSKNTGSASVRDVVAEKELELVQLVRQEMKAKRSSTTIPVEMGSMAAAKSRPPSKARAPNPLSCKKKQSNKSSTTIRPPPQPKTANPMETTGASLSAESRPRKRRRKTSSNASAAGVP
jgi:rRNA-processing protein FCF1